MVESESAPRKPKKERSPNYPGIDLGEAIERAKKLYQMEGRNAAPLKTALEHWGYKPQSGAGLVAVAALKRFGLIDDEGRGDRRRIRLSDLALRIIRDDRPNSRERLKSIQTAALTPPIHGELWSEFKSSLPSDENLKYTLKMHKGFTDLGAKEFVRQFRSTIAFAKLTESAMLTEEPEDKQGEENEDANMGSPSSIAIEEPSKLRDSSGGQQRAVQLPISANRWAILQAPFPMSESAWEQMMAVLEAMKPALVKDEEVQGNDEDG
jgi:hypothetical protein